MLIGRAVRMLHRVRAVAGDDRAGHASAVAVHDEPRVTLAGGEQGLAVRDGGGGRGLGVRGEPPAAETRVRAGTGHALFRSRVPPRRDAVRTHPVDQFGRPKPVGETGGSARSRRLPGRCRAPARPARVPSSCGPSPGSSHGDHDGAPFGSRNVDGRSTVASGAVADRAAGLVDQPQQRAPASRAARGHRAPTGGRYAGHGPAARPYAVRCSSTSDSDAENTGRRRPGSVTSRSTWAGRPGRSCTPGSGRGRGR